jgi:aminoglycoside phosphotransferase (APT) family kinase protein
MNVVLSFLEANRIRLKLAEYGVDGPLACVVITPRFRASSHVIFLVSAGERAEPMVVAKVPRLAQATTSIELEVKNLRAVQGLRAEGFASVPRVIAFEHYCGYPILVETALVGRPLDPAAVRRDLHGCCQKVTTWLSDLQPATVADPKQATDWFDRLVEAPLRYFAERFPASSEETELLDQTRTLVEPLRSLALPSVFEHGDLSHPNLILLKDGQLGVLDWELADPQGLPAYDLFFFLTYAAFALTDARSSGAHLPAFQTAFWGKQPWAAQYITAYAQRLQLPATALKPLFVFSWLRYLTGLLMRLDNAGQEATRLGPETATWLRANRYYSLWQHAVTHADTVAWG